MPFKYPESILGFKNIKDNSKKVFLFDGDTNIRKIIHPKLLKENNLENIIHLIAPLIWDLSEGKDIVEINYSYDKIKYQRIESYNNKKYKKISYKRINN